MTDRAETLFAHFRYSFLDRLLATDEHATFEETSVRRATAVEVRDRWLPMAVASGCFPAGAVKQWVVGAFNRDAAGDIFVTFDDWPVARSPDEWTLYVDELRDAGLDSEEVHDAIQVALTATTDPVANSFVARLLFGRASGQVEMLGDRARELQDVHGLVRVAAELPLWVTDGPYRLRASLTFLGDEIGGRVYGHLKAWLRERELLDRWDFWMPQPLGEGGRPGDSLSSRLSSGDLSESPLWQLARAERRLVPAPVEWDEVDRPEGDFEPVGELEAEREGPLVRLFRAMRWRLLPDDQHVDDLMAFHYELSPVRDAVLRASMSDGAAIRTRARRI